MFCIWSKVGCVGVQLLTAPLFNAAYARQQLETRVPRASFIHAQIGT